MSCLAWLQAVHVATMRAAPIRITRIDIASRLGQSRSGENRVGTYSLIAVHSTPWRGYGDIKGGEDCIPERPGCKAIDVSSRPFIAER
jgi:hypothetical protein